MHRNTSLANDGSEILEKIMEELRETPMEKERGTKNPGAVTSLYDKRTRNNSSPKC